MFIPKIRVEISDIDYNIGSIAELLYNDFKNNSLPFKERVYHTFPQLAERIKPGMADSNIYDVVKAVIYDEYQNNYSFIEERKEGLLQTIPDVLNRAIARMLDLFELEWPKEIEYISCYLGFYTVFPRDVLTKEYWLHYKTPEDIVIRASIHEINHFILFEKWKSMHGYTKKEQPSYPDVLWFLEEMAIDPTLNTEEIQSVAPYPHKAYKCFYENTLNEVPIIDYIIKIFENRKNIADFLDKSYEFIAENYNHIRKCV